MDQTGKSYIDFLAGIAVCQLGHAHPRLVAALSAQAEKLWHVSNYFEVPEQSALADRLVEKSGLDAVFFGNSGAEANEALIKIARLWGKSHRDGAYEIITLSGSFHGRTMAGISATGQDKVKVGFEPLLPGFVHVPFGDLDALSHAISEKTVAILIEVIQGEGGVRPLSSEYLAGVQHICRKKNLLLLVDEVQTGIGRTGTWFGFQSVASECAFLPDGISLAKGLAGGFPIGACVVGKRLAPLFVPGTHASTFGGNPLAACVALELLDVIESEHVLQMVNETGAYFRSCLEALKAKYPFIREVRGRGLMLGLECSTDVDVALIVTQCLDHGLVANVVQGYTLRFVPSLLISKAEIDAGLEILERVMVAVKA